MVYVLTSGLIGTAVELLRLPELAYYLYYRLTAKTRWQKERALRKVTIRASIILDRSSGYHSDFICTLYILHHYFSLFRSTLYIPFSQFNFYVDV